MYQTACNGYSGARKAELGKAPSEPVERHTMQISALAAPILSIGAVAATTITASNSATIAQNVPSLSRASNDARLTMPMLEAKGWFIHAHNGKVRPAPPMAQALRASARRRTARAGAIRRSVAGHGASG